MISDKIRANRLRRSRELKSLYEVQLEYAVTPQDKDHLKARIAEVDRDIVTTKGDTVETAEAPSIPPAEGKYVEPQSPEIPDRENLEGVTPPGHKSLLPTITERPEDESKVAHPYKTKRSRKRKVGNPF